MKHIKSHTMEENLNELMQLQITRMTKRLHNAFEKRMSVANDKLFAVEQFEKRLQAVTEFRKDFNDDFREIIEAIEDDYKLGNPIALSIKKFRKNYHDRETIQYTSQDFVQTDENGNNIEIVEEQPKSKVFDTYSDKDIVWLFVQHKAYENFLEFIATQVLLYSQQSQSTESGKIEKDIPSKYDEFTTTRQVLAMHYLLKYCQVRNVDESVKARFIHFLTSKNYSKIYDRIRNPLEGSSKRMKQDLKYVQAYFEELEMTEIVKMITNEIAQSV